MAERWLDGFQALEVGDELRLDIKGKFVLIKIVSVDDEPAISVYVGNYGCHSSETIIKI